MAILPRLNKLSWIDINTANYASKIGDITAHHGCSGLTFLHCGLLCLLVCSIITDCHPLSAAIRD